jgi:hypothetical protein
VFSLIANDRCNAQLEVFGRFDWPLHGSQSKSAERQHIRVQIKATSIFAEADFVNVL